MRNEKLFFIFLILISSFLALFYFWGLRKEFRSVWEEKKSGEVTIDKLQAQLKQLAEFQDSLNKSEAMLRDELRREQEKVLDLDENLKKSVSLRQSLAAKLSQAKTDREKAEELQRKLEELALKNQTLKQGIEDTRKKFELIQPLKDKLSGVESALGALELKKGKQDLLNVQLESISQELSSINNYMLQLLGNNISPIRDFTASGGKSEDKNLRQSSQDAGEYKEEIEKLKTELKTSEKEHASLKQLYQDVQGQLAQTNKELNARAEKIFTLQEKVMRMENNLFQVHADFKEMEKNAAVLREKYVAVELEKSGLQIALDQTRQELTQLQGKFLSLLGRIGGIFQSSEELPNSKSSKKSNLSNNTKIDVELIPQGAK